MQKTLPEVAHELKTNLSNCQNAISRVTDFYSQKVGDGSTQQTIEQLRNLDAAKRAAQCVENVAQNNALQSVLEVDHHYAPVNPLRHNKL
jgi:hypothetical protein